ncbi:Trp biosynthesis-associated membrane protein [Blastococcus saxobsidens]|uniref:Putative membrane protein (TIGR02234 family) n=1 Tax=Blastococcus saxobsidens TaxID=138336 RepID=A0A4Q7Y3I3_9ACTN|nr:Trp biosynthesis-associated membrane protein [Blastococcus saxobsidens]RZU31410.1 putative membrane protein (TIGR02234 family) [Blastococcus saxobsidens]
MSDGARRELTGAVLGCLVAGALVLSASGQRWADVTAERRSPLPPVSAALSGGDVAPLATAAGLVLLAAAVALLAVRGAGRAAVGLVTAAAGGALVWSGVRVLAGGVADAAADLPGLTGSSVVSTAVDVSPVWPALSLLAGLLALVVGLLTAVRGRTWPAMGRRYERTATTATPARPRTDEDRAQDAWKALDRGEDPTEPPPPARSGDPL